MLPYLKMENLYKIDEGYSEEPMRMESGIDDGAGPDDLLEGSMALSEIERSGGPTSLPCCRATSRY